MSCRFSTNERFEIRVGARRRLAVGADVAGWADGDNTVTTVSSITVPDSGVVVSNITIVDDKSIEADYDATAATARDEDYVICIHLEIDGKPDVATVPLLVKPGC